MQKYKSMNFTSKDYADSMNDAGKNNSDKFNAAPKYIQDSLLFPYNQGLVFVSRLYSQEILHCHQQRLFQPARFNRTGDAPPKNTARERCPSRSSAKDIQSALDEQWKLAIPMCSGEFDIQELLMTELRSADAEKGAAGWGGCQYRMFTNPIPVRAL